MVKKINTISYMSIVKWKEILKNLHFEHAKEKHGNLLPKCDLEATSQQGLGLTFL